MQHYQAQFIRLKKERWLRFSEAYVSDHMAKADDKKVKKAFLDHFFHHQLKWASGTITSFSRIDSAYYQDEWLHFFLKRLPDNYLLFYDPIFHVQQAPVALSHVLLSPMACYVIETLSDVDDHVIRVSNEHFWEEVDGERVTKRLNPLISLDRTEKVVQSLFASNGISLSVKRVVLTKTGYFEYHVMPFGTSFYDQASFSNWHEQMVLEPSPIKFEQMKAADVLLRYTQTTSFKRENDD